MKKLGVLAVVAFFVSMLSCSPETDATKCRRRPWLCPATTTTTSSPTTSTTTTITVPQTTSPSTTTSIPTGQQNWKRLSLGAGGWVTEIEIASDGTKFARTDTYGAYLYVNGVWKQLMTVDSVPNPTPDSAREVYSLAIDPINSSVFWAVYGDRILFSSNKGTTWQTKKSGLVLDGNDNNRMSGEKLIVGPQGVHVGTPAGLLVSKDGGQTWITEALPGALPAPGRSEVDSSAYTGLQYVGTRLYVAVQGQGIYYKDPNSAWTRTVGGPSGALHSDVDLGTLYVTSNDSVGVTSLWKYNGSWTKIPVPSDYTWGVHSVNVKDGRIIIGHQAGDLAESTNNGASWNEPSLTLTSPSIPWLAASGRWMSNGSVEFDPQVSNKLWMSAGGGVWETTFNPGATAITWTANTTGIEQLVVNTIANLANGRTLVSNWDFGIFSLSSPDTINPVRLPSTRFNSAWATAVSPFDPNFVVGVVDDMRGCCTGDGLSDQSGYSTDGGLTWNRFASLPENGLIASWWGFGTIAVSTPDNIVWVASNRRKAYFTKDRGATWQPVSLPGVDPNNYDDMTEMHFAYYLNRHNIVADPVTAGVFYLFHSGKGIYKTVNGGTTWTLLSPPPVSWGAFNAKMKAVPGRAGHLFLTAGGMSGEDAFGNFMRSTDGGTTWTAIPNVKEVRAFGFGKGQNYPTIFIAGWVNNVYGIWKSTNEGASWTQMGTYPMGLLTAPVSIDGDRNIEGRVYVGLAGNGAVYYG